MNHRMDAGCDESQVHLTPIDPPIPLQPERLIGG